MASKSAETVPVEESNKLKRKLDEVEPAESQANKRKLEEAESKMKEDEKKSEQFMVAGKQLVGKPTRARIPLNWAAKKKLILTDSDPIAVVGFKWKLFAYRLGPSWLDLLVWAPPQCGRHKGEFEIVADCSVRILHTISISKDIHKEVGDLKIKGTLSTVAGTVRITEFDEIQELDDPKNGFVHEDGAIHLEVDFIVKTVKLNHFLCDKVDEDEEMESDDDFDEEESDDDDVDGDSGEDEEDSNEGN